MVTLRWRHIHLCINKVEIDDFHEHLDRLRTRTYIQFTKEMEESGTIPFLESAWSLATTTDYERKFTESIPTHTAMFWPSITWNNVWANCYCTCIFDSKTANFASVDVVLPSNFFVSPCKRTRKEQGTSSTNVSKS